jgi:hypothetical protein
MIGVATKLKEAYKHPVPQGGEPMSGEIIFTVEDDLTKEVEGETPSGLRRPQARGRVTMRRVKDTPSGDKPSMPPSLVPVIVGETIKIGVRYDQSMLDVIQEHVDRLAGQTIEVITVTDGIRSLLVEGARSYRRKERLAALASAQTDDEATDE